MQSGIYETLDGNEAIYDSDQSIKLAYDLTDQKIIQVRHLAEFTRPLETRDSETLQSVLEDYEGN